MYIHKHTLQKHMNLLWNAHTVLTDTKAPVDNSNNSMRVKVWKVCMEMFVLSSADNTRQ